MATRYSQLTPVPTYFGPVSYSDITECHTLEFFKYADDEHIDFVNGIVDEASMSSWLNQAVESPQSSQCIAQGLRILVIPQTWTEERGIVLSISKSSSAVVNSHFGLSDNFIDVLAEHASPACIYPTAKRGNSCSGSRFIKLALKYSPEIRFTFGILLLDSASLPDLSSWGQSLHSYADACILPFLLPIYLIEESLKQGMRGISLQDTRVNRIQEATGQFVPSENFPLPEIDLWKLDYTDLTRQLNFSGDVTSSQIFLLKGLSVALRVLANWNASLASSHSEAQDRGEVLQDQNVVREKLEYIRGGIDAALMHAEHVQRRTEAFRQLVYQLMAQKDSRTNITIAASSAEIAKASKEDSAVMRQIALDTKRDSSAMKTIATLTMFFLPGTFIAVFLQLPFPTPDRISPVVEDIAC
ncbi:hypothetical protein DL98DRAFT_570898 [Cadophora sp. DSE1049]|nr:hypothetical protein DL98DRAFT_570898 [Cadophora sp. DSE1049]